MWATFTTFLEFSVSRACTAVRTHIVIGCDCRKGKTMSDVILWKTILQSHSQYYYALHAHVWNESDLYSGEWCV